MSKRIVLPKRRITLTPRQFAAIKVGDVVDIASVTVVPPKFGHRGFGMVEVQWKHRRNIRRYLDEPSTTAQPIARLYAK
jgi:hypothetical protein